MYDDGEESGDEAFVVTITSYHPYIIADTGWFAIENTVSKLISLGKTIPT